MRCDGAPLDTFLFANPPDHRSLILLGTVLAQIAELRTEVQSLFGDVSGDGERFRRELDRIERQAWRLLIIMTPSSLRRSHH